MSTIVQRAKRRHAYFVFVDEAGFMLSPYITRTWAPRGCTPVIKVAEPHERISVLGAITISPHRRHFAFHFQLSADNANFRGSDVAAFLKRLYATLRNPITVLWDEIRIHRATPVLNYLRQNRKIVIEEFPPYAPELNPVDYVWSYVKCRRLANYTPFQLSELRYTITKEFVRLQKRPDLLEAFFHHTGLTLDPVDPEDEGIEEPGGDN